MTIDEWKLWYENLERQKLSKGPISLTMIRPSHTPINTLTNMLDGVHPLHSATYDRRIKDE